jgi:hypothetical protein
MAATAAHMRARSVPTLWAHVAANVDLQAASEPVQQQAQQVQPSPSNPDRTPFARPTQRSLTLDEEPRSRGRSGGASSAAARAVVPMLSAIHTLAHALIPAGWLSLSMLHVCVMGSVYAVGPALGWLLPVLAPAEALVVLAQPLFRSHWPMRMYAAVHIIVALAVCLVEPWLPRWVPQLVVGANGVSLHVHVAPVMAMFVLATAHAALGTYLAAPVGTTQAPHQARGQSESARSITDRVQTADVCVPLLAAHQARDAVATEDVQRLGRLWQPARRFAGLWALHFGVLASA